MGEKGVGYFEGISEDRCLGKFLKIFLREPQFPPGEAAAGPGMVYPFLHLWAFTSTEIIIRRLCEISYEV